jgi:MFS family permease
MLSIKQLRAMRPSMRALVFLYWLYQFASSTTAIFTQVYLYQLFQSVTVNIISIIMLVTGVMLGFSVWGFIAAHYRLNIRHGFAASFATTSIAMLMLPWVHTTHAALLAILLGGIGVGLFWLAIHTYELSETHDHERDVYSSYLSVGDQVMTLAGPAFATVLIWIAHQFNIHELTLLFMSMPLMYLTALPVFRLLRDYRPKPVRWHDIKHFVTDRRNQLAQVYLAGSSTIFVLNKATVPLVAILILGTALNVGLFATVTSLFSILAILIVGAYRHPKNRVFLYGVATAIIVAITILMGIFFTFPMFVAYTLIMAIAFPLLRVSQHTIDLKTMDSIGHKESDFYPTMLLRDFSFWIWRTLFALIVLAATWGAGTSAHAVAIMLYCMAGTYIVSYLGARWLMQTYND